MKLHRLEHPSTPIRLLLRPCGFSSSSYGLRLAFLCVSRRLTRLFPAPASKGTVADLLFTAARLRSSDGADREAPASTR